MQEEKNVLYGPPDVVSEFKSVSMGQLILNQLMVHGKKVAQVNAHTGEEKTFESILNSTRKLAIALAKGGVTKDDKIAVCSENNLQFCLPVCAAFYLGATLCPLNPMYSERELKHALGISKPKYIFVSSVAVSTMCKVAHQLSWSPKIVLLSEIDKIKLPSIKDLITDITAPSNYHAHSVDIENHIAVISCSSGTTGVPKGVMLTDKNMLTAIRHISAATPESLSDNMPSLALLPFSHVYAFTMLLVRLVLGNKIIILSHFDEKTFLHSIEKYRIKNLLVVPPLMVFLAKHPLVDRYDLSSIEEIWCGAAPLSEQICKAVAKRLNVYRIKQGYGMTETTLAVIKSPDNNTKYGSVGILAPGVIAKVIPLDGDESYKALGPNREGELCFKGDLIMKGYCNDEKATTATIDKDGWLHSGDVGYYDEDGYFYVVDRLKELIKYKGFQVPPAELEALLLTCPGIKDVAVVGLPNEEAGELPFAFVVKQDGSKLTEDDVIKYVSERVSSHKRLRGGMKFVASIPKTASGKILRRVLRDTLKSKL